MATIGEARATDGMHAVRSLQRIAEFAFVAAGAFGDRAGMALDVGQPSYCRWPGIGVRPNGMGAAVATFTAQATVAFVAAVVAATQAIEREIRREARAQRSC